MSCYSRCLGPRNSGRELEQLSGAQSIHNGRPGVSLRRLVFSLSRHSVAKSPANITDQCSKY